MTQAQASPSTLEAKGTRERRIVLTRAEFVKIILRVFDEVNSDEKKLPGFLDRLFDEAERDGAIVFDTGEIPGRRFK